MLTFARSKARRTLRLTAIAGAVFALPLITFASMRPAQAEGVRIDTCVGSWGADSCATLWAPLGNPYIRKVPQPRDGAERARAIEEDRLWVERCQPTVRADRYGVARYHYVRPGCEFGVTSY